MNALNKRQLSLAVSAALATTLTSGLAFGQDDDETVEEVIVTGTRIATTDGFGATSPVTVVTAENIKNLGFVNIEQVLNSLPSIETSQNNNISNGSSGTATVDLRGIGSQSYPGPCQRSSYDGGCCGRARHLTFHKSQPSHWSALTC